MSVLPIVTFDDPILRIKTNPVISNTDQVQTLIDNMFETMENARGVGLAAPQIGHKERIFVIDADVMDEENPDGQLIGPTAFINPEIVEESEDLIPMEEGCLSIPEVRDKVERPKKIKVRFLDRDFNSQELTADFWLSRVIQHEYDHLFGKLFIDYLSKFRSRMIKKKLDQIDQGELDAGYPLKPKLKL